MFHILNREAVQNLISDQDAVSKERLEEGDIREEIQAWTKIGCSHLQFSIRAGKETKGSFISAKGQREARGRFKASWFNHTESSSAKLAGAQQSLKIPLEARRFPYMSYWECSGLMAQIKSHDCCCSYSRRHWSAVASNKTYF